MTPVSSGSHCSGVSDDPPNNGSEAPYLVIFPQKYDKKSWQQDEEYAGSYSSIQL